MLITNLAQCSRTNATMLISRLMRKLWIGKQNKRSRSNTVLYVCSFYTSSIRNNVARLIISTKSTKSMTLIQKLIQMQRQQVLHLKKLLVQNSKQWALLRIGSDCELYEHTVHPHYSYSASGFSSI